MVEEPKCVTWEEDQDDETQEYKIVKAPNNKYYKIKPLNALENAIISNEVISYEAIAGEENSGKSSFKFDNVRHQILTLKYGVVEPDLSKRTEAEIRDWMRKKAGTAIFLTNEIAKISGFTKRLLGE